MKREQGFTLIEIAIVAGHYRPAARRRAQGSGADYQRTGAYLISTQDGVKAAYFGFLDRYRGLPGDIQRRHRQYSNCTVARTATTTDRSVERAILDPFRLGTLVQSRVRHRQLTSMPRRQRPPTHRSTPTVRWCS